MHNNRIAPMTAVIALLGAGFSPTWAQSTLVTLLHTNDLHSHLSPERSIQQLGGVARLKTLVDRVKAQKPETYLLDAGDWSEGSIYYTQDSGAETLRLMDQIGYDATVVGNHDWINGPETLIGTLSSVKSRLFHLSSNLELSRLSATARKQFSQYVLPHVVLPKGKARIGVIGVSTYEVIYDDFFKPVEILAPFEALRSSVRALKSEGVDAIVVLSHNSIAMNRGILQAVPEVDLVIGAHDHIKLNRPVRVARSGAPEGWIVETGMWGRYLGQVQLQVFPGENRRPQLESYLLHALDRTVPLDPGIADQVARIENAIEGRMGPVFQQTVGHSDVHLGREGLESRMGNFATDAYRLATGSDIAIDVINMIYGEIFPGPVRLVDVFNANPAVFSPQTQKAWTLHTLPMKGSTLRWVLNLLLSSKQLSQLGFLTTSGLEATFLPSRSPDPMDESITRQLESLKIAGTPIQAKRTYQVTINKGLVRALEFLNAFAPNMIPTGGLKDTGIQAWEAMRAHLPAGRSLTQEDAPLGGRLRSLEADLSIVADEIQLSVSRSAARAVDVLIRAPIRNLGMRPLAAQQIKVRVLNNSLGNSFSQDPDWREYGGSQPVSGLAFGETQWLQWKVRLPVDEFGIGHVYLQTEGTQPEIHSSNNHALRWFQTRPNL